MPNYFYRIEGLAPHGEGLHSYSFSAYVDGGFAKKAFETKLPERGRKNIDSMGKETLRRLFGNDRLRGSPYHFVDDTCLLRFIQVPGDACDLGIDGSDVSDIRNKTHDWYRVEYKPHNVDSHTQAYALASLFLRWADLAEAVMSLSR